MNNQASEQDTSEAFTLPGGYGFAPLNFTPGQGHFSRPPVLFTTSLETGYDDNIYCTDNAPGQKPKHGSMITYLSEELDLLLAQSRTGFSMSARGGGQYYWDRDGQHLFPVGNIDLLYAYKFTPQTQLSVQLNAAYQTQPTFSVLQGLTDANAEGYFTGSAKVDLLHRWTPRFSTTTTYLGYGTRYSGSANKDSNHMNNTVGQAFNYAFSRIVSGVVEGRAGQDTYDGNGGNSQNYYGLVGTDLTFSRRLSSSIRLGSETRVPDDGDSETMPYAEGSVNYILTRTTLVGWQLRYGYEDTNNTSGTAKCLRTGISLTQNFTPKLRGTLGFNVSNDDVLKDKYGNTVENSYSAISVSAGLNYAVTKTCNVFANYSRIDKFSPSDYIKYSKNVYYVGASIQY